ncbi:hypothetical protein NEMBOFW57_010607 [Staphylotrichum longicolle]|uniref:Uncharacterized protein n=1 Tax=Staphylotrichum longicolle TaxID=669026 RepID=A0AAD4ERV9_9PEZI|nr:hypothetical protein NEMBOFW57_010607 [Staphylotrichum longicolle]
MEQYTANLRPAYDKAQYAHAVFLNIKEKKENLEIEISLLADSSTAAKENRKKNRAAVDEYGNVDAEEERRRIRARKKAREHLEREFDEMENLYKRYRSDDQIAASEYDKLKTKIERAKGEIITNESQLQQINSQIEALEQQLYDSNNPSSQPPPGHGGGSGGGGSGGGGSGGGGSGGGYPSAGGWDYSTYYGGSGHPDYGYQSGGGGTSSPQSYSGSGGGKSHQAYPTQKGVPSKFQQVGKSSDKPPTSKNSQASASASKLLSSTTTTTASKQSKQSQHQPTATPTAAMKASIGSGATKTQPGPGATTTLPTHPKAKPASSKPVSSTLGSSKPTSSALASSKPAVQKKSESWHK